MLRISRIALLATALLTAPLSQAKAQTSTSSGSEAPQQAFSWAMSSSDLGNVRVPTTTTSASVVGAAPWNQGPLGTRYRAIPSFTGEPTYEVVIGPGYSGNPSMAERILIQIPAGFYGQPWSNRAMVVGFHSFSVSEKDVFLNSSLAWRCAARKWLLVAPYGLTDTNYGNPQSQASLEAIGHILYSLIPFNYRRVYGVGFSMGGLSALSYAMRHMDPWQLQFAGVVAHTSPLDMRREVVAKPYIAQLLLSGADHFGADFASAPFEYERVSPVRFLTNGLVDSSDAPVVNLSQRPIFLHANLADPDPLLVSGMTELRSFLTSRGALVQESLVYDPVVGHDWTTMPMGQALDFVGQYQLPAVEPPVVEIFADRPHRWPHVEVISQSPDTFARYEFELSPGVASTSNSCSLLNTRELDQVLIDSARLGLDANVTLELRHSTADGSSDTLLIGGFTSAPTSISVNGGAPDAWSYDATLEELSIRPTSDGSAAVVVVAP